MSTPSGQHPFPIPLVSAMGPGSQIEDEELDYLPMPQGMSTYQPPRLPEPDALDGHGAAIAVLDQVLAVLQAAIRGESVAPVDLSGLSAADREIVNQALGEGEVGAQVADGQGSALVQVQESVFAGVWRVIERLPDGGLQDRIEVGAIPEVLKTCARQDGASGHRPAARLPEGVMNAPTLLQELHDQRQQWRVGQSAHLVNLSLLPLSPADMACLEEQLGTGRVVILSRGYGNCRISSTRVPTTWRVVYYNSQDAMILNSIEVVDMPEVACAAPEDLVDSQQRLREVMAWVNRI
jgi:hydrogenase-1 operon protein HyaF